MTPGNAAGGLPTAVSGSCAARHAKDHSHGVGCGHEIVPHGDHKDYVVGGHLHKPHGQHCDDHGALKLG